jgi:hypothetical protein
MVGPRESATRDLIAAAAAVIERWLEVERVVDLAHEMAVLELSMNSANHAYERPT